MRFYCKCTYIYIAHFYLFCVCLQHCLGITVHSGLTLCLLDTLTVLAGVCIPFKTVLHVEEASLVWVV